MTDKADAEAIAAAVAEDGRPKRDRKTVQVYKPEEVPEKSTEIVIKKGAGMKLEEISNVAFKIGKVSRTEEILRSTHKFLFGKPPKGITDVKPNLLQFSGFVYDEEEKEHAAKERQLSKYTKVGLNELCDLFDVPRGSGEEGHKEKQVERLLKFLEKPEPTEGARDLQAAEDKKTAEKQRKRAASSAKKDKDEPPAKPAAKKAKKAPARPASAGKSGGSGTGSEIAAVQAQLDAIAKKLAKKEAELAKKEKAINAKEKQLAGSKRKAPEKATPSKKAMPSAKSSKKKAEEEEEDEEEGEDEEEEEKEEKDEDEDEGEEAEEKGEGEGGEEEEEEAGGPTEESVKDATIAYLKGADLTTATYKTVVAHLEKKFPDLDTAAFKPLVKATIQEVVEADGEAEAE